MNIDAVNLEMTDACNLRCTMCDIWKETHNSHFSSDMVDTIFASNVLSRSCDITLTGGEAFLHPELFSVVRRILQRRPRGVKTLSTNGVLTKNILAFMSHFYGGLSGDFSVHISFDGIHSHDVQRGKKSKHLILETVKRLQEHYPTVPIKIKYTITPLNCRDVLDTYLFCKRNKLVFKPKIVEYAPNYTNRALKRAFVFTADQKKQIQRDLLIVNRELQSRFIFDSIKYLYGTNEPHFCLTPFNRAFIMATGDVYSCIHFSKIGNIHEASLDSIWNSSTAQMHRNQVDREKCQKCVSYHGRGSLTEGKELSNSYLR